MSNPLGVGNHKKKVMRIATMNASVHGFRKLRANSSRMNLALDILYQMKEYAVDLITFPAGYFAVEHERDTTELLAPLYEKAAELGISFIVGVDETRAWRLAREENQSLWDLLVESFHLPCYLYCFEADSGNCLVWRQRNMTTYQAASKMTSVWLAGTERTITVHGHRFSILLCGECYCRETVGAIAKKKPPPSAVLISGHIRMPRMGKTTARISRDGLAVLHSEHRIGREGLLYAIAANQKVLNHRDSVTIEGRDKSKMWSEIALWEFSENGTITSLFLE